MMKIFGAGRPGRNLPRYFPSLAPTPSSFYPLLLGRGGGGVVVRSAPPPVLFPPRDPWGLPVWEERVDAWLRPPVSTSCTVGASSPPQ